MRRHYPSSLLYLLVGLLVVANTINLGADLGAMGAALKLLIGGPMLVYIVLFGIVSVLLETMLLGLLGGLIGAGLAWLLFDQALSGREAAARDRLPEVLAERARGGEDRQALLDDILKIVLDPEIGDDQVGARLRGEIGTSGCGQRGRPAASGCPAITGTWR